MATDDAYYSFELHGGETLPRGDFFKTHYVPKSERTSCQNKECGLIFGYQSLRRPHHCRRCGEIFCRPCLQYTRRLNDLANPDPLGIPRKVCLNCFNERDEDHGCTKRSHTVLFNEWRQQARHESRQKPVHHDALGTYKPKFWKDQFQVDILKECRRLLNGFKTTAVSSEVVMTLKHIKEQIKVPSWQKSTFWALESDMTTCRLCQRKAGHRKNIRNCRVCGISLCKLCAYKELLIYIEDEPRSIENQSKGGGPPQSVTNEPHSKGDGSQSVEGGPHSDKSREVKLSIIKVIGSPEKEPVVSVLLYCCYDCRTEIIQKQIEDVHWYKQISKPRDLQSEIVRIDDDFRQLTGTINMNIEKYIALIEEIKNEKIIKENNNNTFKGSMERLDINTEPPSEEILDECKEVKDQLGQNLDSYLTLFNELRRIYDICEKPQGSHLHLAKNYIMAKKDYYLETKAHIGKLSQHGVREKLPTMQ